MLQAAMRSTIHALTPAPILRHHYLKQIEQSTTDDEADLALFPRIIRPEWFTVDIGANIGRYTKHLSRLSHSVISIEPTPFTFSVLDNNVRQLRLSNVKVLNCALSDHLGKGSMNVPNIYEAKLTEGSDISVRTLDSLLNGAPVDFIKCDVEGHELNVLKGSLKTIKSCSPMWLVESDWDSPIFDFMDSLGYSCFVHSCNALVPRDNRRSTNYWFSKDMDLN